MIFSSCETQALCWGKRRGSGCRRVDPDEPLENDASVPFHAAAGGRRLLRQQRRRLSLSLALSEKMANLSPRFSLAVMMFTDRKSDTGKRRIRLLGGTRFALAENDASVLLPFGTRRSVSAIGNCSEVLN
ncbi:hypothetical protein TIFTF001_036609 [Ficus carica]|uniref:Uncharacterized protein n=1 Tax=Ficus carica TaxID=3494 RepID=A0AA88E4M3_FICCA|nr:hypothetical protein TIFTF001_036605 [Ficus carica]GMN67550.1 hypothetical protein TIFTF001_036609 [Ficus carica]